MEMPHIGTQCGNPSCNQLDFLPFRCSGCTKQFCINHRKQGDHSCTAGAILEDTVIPVCPLCFSSVPIRNGENPNEIVERHINAGCPDHDDERRQRKKAKACSLRSCGKSELVPIICPDCNRQFCLT
jgi:predicted nucleic acid binding AN1-type Zn finger protein